MTYMEGLRSRLASGTAFERFMRAPDKTPYAFTGGDLGWRSPATAERVPGDGSGARDRRV